MNLSRRNFLWTASAATGLGTLAGCRESFDPYALKRPPVPGEDEWALGEERMVTTSCSQCHAGCSIMVRVVQGRAVKVEGNPDCPLNGRGVGPKGQSGPHVLYHPDRLRGPLKREGERGSGKLVPVSWEEAIKDIAARLQSLRDKGESRSVVVLDGEPRGSMPQLWGRFLDAYGSPNYINHRSTTDGARMLAMKYMQGASDVAAIDWKNTNYILGFGETLLESSCQGIYAIRAAAWLREGVPGKRGKFLQVSSEFSLSATKADEWVAVGPGAVGAVALGLAHVLIRDDLYDQAFVAEHTFGFEAWENEQGKHRGFRDLVMEDYTPEKVSEITGVSAETIERLAHEAAGHRPAVAIVDDTAVAATNGLATAMAVHALNALLGNLERPGGVLVQHPVPLTPWAEVALDESSRDGLAATRIDGAGTPSCPLGDSVAQSVGGAILNDSPYPVGAMFLYRSNPAFSKPDGKSWIDAFAKVPLVVSFSPLPDESTLWADYVLPDHTYFERWDLVEPVPSTGAPVLCLRQPVVEPLYDTRATGDVVIQLAQAMGSPIADAFPWKDYREALVDRLKGVQQAQSGSIVADDEAGFLAELEKNGGWWEGEREYEQWEQAFPTPSGKFEFYSQTIAQRLAQSFPDASSRADQLQAMGVATPFDEICLPHWEPARFAGEAGEDSFILDAYRSIDYAEGGVRHLPILIELPLAGHGGGWKQSVEMHPEDAARLGLGEGDTAVVESPVGQARFVVQLIYGVRPGTVGLHLGHGSWPPTAEQPGKADYGLLVNQSDPLAGVFALHGTRVRIRKEV